MMFRSHSHALAVSCLAGIVLTGCAGFQEQFAQPQGATPPARSWRAPHGRSWMLLGAKHQKLLYASAYSFIYGSSVYVFDYPQLTLAGTLATGALGLCSDKDGNVYATTGGGDILEYAHGGTSPIKTLSDPDGLYNYGCSVDPVTGNLAVTNFYGTSLGAGNVMVYPNASGTPAEYDITGFYYYYFCGYDDKGDLFVDGENINDEFELAELPAKGSGEFNGVELDQSLGIPGNVQWHAGRLAIGDQGDANGNQIIYEFSIKGSAGTKTGSTPLTGAGDVPQFWIQGKDVVAPDTLNLDVALYRYPAGGNALASYYFGTDRNGFGATVSVAPRKK